MYLAGVGAVADTLRERGLQAEQVLDGLGLITGQLPAGRPLTALQVDGVAAVEEARRIRLPRRTRRPGSRSGSPVVAAAGRRQSGDVHRPSAGSEPPSGSFRVVREDAGPVLHLHGDVDEPLVEQMRAAGLDERDLVAVQVASVGYIDSAGLTMLVRWARSAARVGRPAVLRAASPRFREVLDLAGISVLFAHEDDGRA